MSEASTHCPLWFSLRETTSPLGQDALAHPWPSSLLYAFPPTLHNRAATAVGGPLLARETLVPLAVQAPQRGAMGMKGQYHSAQCGHLAVPSAPPHKPSAGLSVTADTGGATPCPNGGCPTGLWKPSLRHKRPRACPCLLMLNAIPLCILGGIDGCTPRGHICVTLLVLAIQC